MERNQILEKLCLMKKELACKQRKLERAKRSACARAHVKQKIKEVNIDTCTGGTALPPSPLPPPVAVQDSYEHGDCVESPHQHDVNKALCAELTCIVRTTSSASSLGDNSEHVNGPEIPLSVDLKSTSFPGSQASHLSILLDDFSTDDAISAGTGCDVCAGTSDSTIAGTGDVAGTDTGDELASKHTCPGNVSLMLTPKISGSATSTIDPFAPREQVDLSLTADCLKTCPNTDSFSLHLTVDRSDDCYLEACVSPNGSHTMSDAEHFDHSIATRIADPGVDGSTGCFQQVDGGSNLPECMHNDNSTSDTNTFDPEDVHRRKDVSHTTVSAMMSSDRQMVCGRVAVGRKRKTQPMRRRSTRLVPLEFKDQDVLHHGDEGSFWGDLKLEQMLTSSESERSLLLSTFQRLCDQAMQERHFLEFKLPRDFICPITQIPKSFAMIDCGNPTMMLERKLPLSSRYDDAKIIPETELIVNSPSEVLHASHPVDLDQTHMDANQEVELEETNLKKSLATFECSFLQNSCTESYPLVVDVMGKSQMSDVSNQISGNATVNDRNKLVISANSELGSQFRADCYLMSRCNKRRLKTDRGQTHKITPFTVCSEDEGLNGAIGIPADLPEKRAHSLFEDSLTSGVDLCGPSCGGEAGSVFNHTDVGLPKGYSVGECSLTPSTASLMPCGGNDVVVVDSPLRHNISLMPCGGNDVVVVDSPLRHNISLMPCGGNDVVVVDSPLRHNISQYDTEVLSPTVTQHFPHHPVDFASCVPDRPAKEVKKSSSLISNPLLTPSKCNRPMMTDCGMGNDWLKFASCLHNTRAEAASRVTSAVDRLVMLAVCGVNTDTGYPTLLIISYSFYTQDAWRWFSLAPPSCAPPHSLLTVGLTHSPMSVVVLGVDKTYTRGKRYTIDQDRCHAVQIALEGAQAIVVDACVVERLPDAVIGFSSAEQSLFIWNHRDGVLVLTVSLPEQLSYFSGMFSSWLFQGFLLVHVSNGDGVLCEVAVHPLAGTRRVLRRYTVPCGTPCEWEHVFLHGNVLLGITVGGALYLFDADSCEAVASMASSKDGAIVTATILQCRSSSWLLTADAQGSVHVFTMSLRC